jgi:hypothetical protein
MDEATDYPRWEHLKDVEPEVLAGVMALEGLTTDGAHHKQWYLAQILKALTGEDFEQMLEENDLTEDDLGMP